MPASVTIFSGALTRKLAKLAILGQKSLLEAV